MSSNRTIILGVVVVVLAVSSGAFLISGTSTEDTGFTLPGTIEATEIRLKSQIGGQVKRVYAATGDYVEAGQNLVDLYSAAHGTNERITSPVDGLVAERLVEPGELAAPGSTLMVVGDLNTLTLKVYVPEDRYGQILLGATYPVTADSFPEEIFIGQVASIARNAEFTPRSVQTTERRKSTRYAIKLNLVPSGGKLRPGMPADVHFEAAH